MIFFSLLNSKLKLSFFKLIFLMFLLGILEVAVLGSIIPLTQALIDKNIILRNEYLSFIINYLNLNENYILIYICILFLVLVFLKTFFSIYVNFLKHRTSNELRLSISKNFIYKFILGNTNISSIKKHFLSNIYYREIPNFVDQFFVNFLLLATEVITFLFIIVFLFWFSFKSTLIVFFIISFLIITYFFFVGKIFKKNGKKRLLAEQSISKWIVQILNEIRDIKIFNRERYFFTEFTNSYKTLIKSIILGSALNESSKNIIEFICFTLLVVVIIFASLNDINNEILLLTLSVFAGAAFRLMPSANRILTCLQTIKFNKEAAKKLLELLDNKIMDNMDLSIFDVKNKLNFSDKIMLKNVSFSYDESSKVIFKNLNFSIKKNSIIGIQGESGSGKTTLINLISGLIGVKEGAVYADNVNIETNLIGWRANIGYIPQKLLLSNDSILKNIAFGKEDNEINLENIKKAIDLSKLISLEKDSYLEFINSDAGYLGEKLSGGQIQRIALARVLYLEKDIFILDEATSALDKKIEKEILDLIYSFKNKKTILIISHDEHVLDRCDKIYLLKNYNLVEKK